MTNPLLSVQFRVPFDRIQASDVEPAVTVLLRDARARLGAERWARAYAAGRGSSIEAMIQDIDRARG